jgi:lipoate-protein ligase A
LTWHLWIDADRRPGWANMAIDSALLDRAERQGERWLRLYGWAPPCLSFGRHEPATRRYDRQRIAELGLDVVRRPTGGRAVWHAGELTYAVAAPATLFGSLQAAYVAIHEMLRAALHTLGANASLAPAGRAARGVAARVDAGACFAQPAGGEVLVGTRKVIGSAQLRQERAFLQHGSILLDNDQAMVGAVTRGDTPPPPDLAAPLGTLLGRTVDRATVAEAVASAAARAWSDHWERCDDAAATGLVDEADAHAGRFRSEEWTWSR